jgi:heme oxygenase
MTEVGAREIGQGAERLRVRLRVETAEWHDRVEAVADVPNSIQTRGAYVELLSRLHELHSPLEADLAAPRFHYDWLDLGVDVSSHRRAHLLAVDLERLGATTPRARTPVRFATFGHALGCVYVLEGSSLGGRTIARLVRETLGEVPTTFLTGEGRTHPSPWQTVCGALTRFEAGGGDGDAVVSGACDTFAAFANHLGRGRPSQMAVALP